MANFDATRIEQLLSTLKAWSESNSGVKGLALVGSWAPEDRQHAEADADVVLLVDDPDGFRNDAAWMSEIDWTSAGLGPARWSECDYGSVCSRHLTFADGATVEVSFVSPAWASVDPVDATTRRVAGNGMRVVHDPSGLLGRLLTVL